MLDLISKVNVYISQKSQQKKEANIQVLGKIARFLTKMIKCFGLTPDTDTPIGFVDASSVSGNVCIINNNNNNNNIYIGYFFLKKKLL